MAIATGTPPNRRMGAPGSPTWAAMLDAAGAVIRDEGYAALTSRRIAERLGIKQRLVYYYFHTMEDLVIEAFRRLSARELARLGEALASERPVHEIWDVCVHTVDARLTSEFMALSSRVARLRPEVIAFIERSREIQVAALEAARVAGGRLPLPPAALALIATSTALSLNREAALGTSIGHAETLAAIATLLGGIEATVRPDPLV